MATIVRILSGAALFLTTAVVWAETPSPSPALLGSPAYQISPEQPVGWRGDWSGRFVGADPPQHWGRRVRGITTVLRYQAAKPTTAAPGKDSHPLEYFTLKDWLIAGPFAVQDPMRDIDQDFLRGEASVKPADGAAAGTSTWRHLYVDVDTQSRHDHNGGTVGNLNIDFVYAFGKFTTRGFGNVDVAGDLNNQVAYAHTYIYAPQAAAVRLRIPFSGVAGRCWLNGRSSPLDPKAGDKSYDVPLVKGWNTLLIKISAARGVTPGTAGGNDAWRSQWLAAAYLEPVPPVTYETQNVAWMTRLTGRSMSQPIVVGDRIYVGANISDLICIAKSDGRVLWLRSTTPYDSLTPAERSAEPAIHQTIEPLLGDLNRQNEAVVQAINFTHAAALQGLPDAQQTELDRMIKDKTETEKKIDNAFRDIDRRQYPPYFGNEVSSSNGTPCSDGERVYWACGGGIKGPGAQAIVCFDRNGRRVWTVHEVLGSMEHGNHQSPALADGKLIYGVNNTLLALDAKTGAELWKNQKLGEMGSGVSPVIARVDGEAVIVTLKKIARVSDGSEICDSNLNIWGDVTPIVEKGIIYNTSRFRGFEEMQSISEIKIPSPAIGKGKAATIWDPRGEDVSTPVRGTPYSIASPLLIDGVLYGVDITGGMIAVDMQAQRSLYREWLEGYNRYHRYLYGIAASPTLAGKQIYITDDAGYTHLIEPGPTFKELGRNILENLYFSGVGGNPCRQESFYTAPYFDGSAMYLRGEEYLYCLQEKKLSPRGKR
jgi:outer membrane protein assembly factor BamB